ncbi:hypothetical protein WR25_22237 [Diploscapter pachys]|uniref:Ion transport domain-containing protein n=1 Tax=Diploscapter pachys TaxID=2018661 RepID=A0A2A2L7G6_9BILA|nr:hypothetical protein WR25_22237 [Diploscapter pachys]
MLKHPVSELRSFQSLSKYAGGPRSVLGRRTSAIPPSRRRSSLAKRRDELLEAGGSSEGSKEETLHFPETARAGASSSEVSPVRQVEFADENEQIEVEGEGQLPYDGFADPVLHCFYQSRPPRSWALKLVMSPWFDRITMAVILINCITLGMYRPCDDGPTCSTYRFHILDIVDNCIFVYFTLEMMIKVIALGLVGPTGYLADTWNRLDFFIVIAGIVEVVLADVMGGSINLTAIRTVRVLRPLRAVNRIPSMRILVNLLLDTLPMLGNVLLLCFFVFFIFGIVGVQLWAGLLRYYIPEDTSLEYICSQNDANGLHKCDNLPPYTQNGIKCNLTLDQFDQISNTSCINWNIYYNLCQVEERNPFQGSVSFDNIGFAWISIFLVISLEGWTDIMYYVQDAHSFWNWIYFVLLIVIGAFFMINLCLVVIATQFAETKRRETERMLEERKRMARQDSICTGSEQALDSSKVEGGSVYAAIVRMISYTFRRAKRQARRRYKTYMDARKEQRQNAEIYRRKSKLDEMATLSRIEERMEEEEDDEKPNSNAGNQQNAIVLVKKIGNGSVRDYENDETATDDDINESEFSSDEQEEEKPRSSSKWQWFRFHVKRFVDSDHFSRSILVAILVNTLSMGVEHHQQPEIFTTILEYSNLFFTGLFAFEMLLKVIAYGLFGYLADGFNLFDGGIVALSVLELFQDGKGGLSVLRTFRLLRILKLVRFMPALRVFGMILFGRKFCNHKETGEQCNCLQIERGECICDRMNYDTFMHSTLTILTQEDWNMVLFNGMSQTNPWAALYFVALMTFGNYVLFNLLVAILVEGFQESKEEEKRQQEEEARKHALEEEEQRKAELEALLAKSTSPGFINGAANGACICFDRRHTPLHLAISAVSEPDPFARNANNRHRSNEERQINSDDGVLALIPSSPTSIPLKNSPLSERSLPMSPILKGTDKLHRHTSLTLPTQNGSVGRKPRERTHSWSGVGHIFNENCPIHNKRTLIEIYAREQLAKAGEELKQALAEEERKKELKQNTLFITLTQKKWFDYTILLFIGINCVTLAMERPSIPPYSIERKFLDISGYIFTIIFTAEMLMKVIANGCVFGDGAYFKDGWNVLDGILVIISLINVGFEMFVTGDSPKIFGVIRVLRLLRALRPLRVINRAPGVKLVVMTLISSLKPIGNIVLICCTFFVIFGILGVQLFKGMMYHCTGPDIANVTTKDECLQDSRNKWVNHRYNFDNLGQALMSLFVLSSKDGWVSIMYQGIDAVGVDIQPIENYNEWRMIYFISFLLLVGFFVLNMFVGVVVENFHKCKEALEKEMREKAKEKQLQRQLKRQKYEESQAGRKKRAQELARRERPYYASYGRTRLFLHGIVTSKYFDLAIAAVIGINVISMAMEFYMMPVVLKYVLKALNYFFTAVFTLEAIMKLVALGFRRFLKEKWNQLDMFIVILSIAGIIFEEFEALELPINPTIIRVMRVLRIARVLKLLKMAKGIRSLLDTVGEALPQVGNLGSLFFLLFFIFAALGVELFGRLECSEDHPCDGLGEHAHFKNFGMAFLTLFRIATGDNWNGVLKDALRDDCDSSDRCESNCCVDPILAPCFFVVFVLISQFVLVNVVVAVLMKHLEESNKKDAENEEKDLHTDGDLETAASNDILGDEQEPEQQIEIAAGNKRLSLQTLERELAEVEEKVEERMRKESAILGDSNYNADRGDTSDENEYCGRRSEHHHTPCKKKRKAAR